MSARPPAGELEACLRSLRSGGVVGCPTETQIGLLADALDANAVARVCAIKGRSSIEPLGLLAPSLESVLEWLEPPGALARDLSARYWPGPLTLVLRLRATPPPAGALPAAVQKAGRVAVRVPGDSPALTLVRAFGRPLTATSANRSGEPACVTEAELRARLGDELDAVMPGDAPGGPPSTLLDVSGETPIVLRRGAIVLDEHVLFARPPQKV